MGPDNTISSVLVRYESMFGPSPGVAVTTRSGVPYQRFKGLQITQPHLRGVYSRFCLRLSSTFRTDANPADLTSVLRLTFNSYPHAPSCEVKQSPHQGGRVPLGEWKYR